MQMFAHPGLREQPARPALGLGTGGLEGERLQAGGKLGKSDGEFRGGQGADKGDIRAGSGGRADRIGPGRGR